MGGLGKRQKRLRSGGYRSSQHAPVRQPTTVIVQPRRGGMFRDAAAIAGGVTLGTAAGHVAGEAVTRLFSGPNRREVQETLPRGYDPQQEPSGPCAYQISQFLQCATQRENLQECAQYNEALKECKWKNRIP